MLNFKYQKSSDGPNKSQQDNKVKNQSCALSQKDMEKYIEDKKILYNTIIDFLFTSEENDDDMYYFNKLTEIIKDQHILEVREEMEHFLQTIKNISDNHHRERNFFNNVNKILQHCQLQIKKFLTSIEIFHIFENNKMIVLSLFKSKIITFSEELYNEMMDKIESNGNRYCYFFYPELEKFTGESMQTVKKELLEKDQNIFENYEEKRNEGENDSYICSLIRRDLVEEFISYVTYNNYSLSKEIKPSIFETNTFLIDNKNTTLIEYASFFGSIQIIQYLLFSNVKISSLLWLYSIHSKNAELIHLLESNEVLPPKEDNNNDYLICLNESIKCHHNDIAEYIGDNLCYQNKYNSEQKELIVSNCIKYHNYGYWKIDSINEFGFFYLSFYGYNKLVDLLMKNKEKEIEQKRIQKSYIFYQEIIFLFSF